MLQELGCSLQNDFPPSAGHEIWQSCCSKVSLCPGDEGLIGCGLKVAIRDNPCAAAEALDVCGLRGPLYFPRPKKKKRQKKNLIKNERKKDSWKRKMSWGKGGGMGGSWEEIIATSENSYYGSNSLGAA